MGQKTKRAKDGKVCVGGGAEGHKSQVPLALDLRLRGVK
jgi:hypothetical protein